MKHWIVLSLLGLVACDDGGTGAVGDCRQVNLACAPGFVCVSGEGGAWACEPGRPPADGAVQPDRGVDLDEGPQVDPDASPPDASSPDADVPRARPAGPCGPELPCLEGTCREDLPGGFCRVECGDDADCGAGGICTAAGLCRSDCADLPCRTGWVCTSLEEDQVCSAHCDTVGCTAPLVCDAATGLCGEPPPCVEETCNDKDDDCDGLSDEGVKNACGVCGPVPEEVCNESDDDCDGTVDEGVGNACGTCGAVPDEQCDGADNDCDGAVDEGQVNACGQCGNLPADICDGMDSDCDGRVDEAPACPAGQVCQAGVCSVPPSGPGGPCRDASGCRIGECVVGPGIPGGICWVECGQDADCGGNAVCTALADANVCLETCGGGCRAGWVCFPDVDVCLPNCQSGGCADGYVCRADGLCEVPLVTVTVGQVFIQAGLLDGSNWDGFGNAPQGAVAAVTAALGAPSVLGALAAAYANDIFNAFDPPDPFGTANLTGPWPDNRAVNLPAIQDTYTPSWGTTWRGVALDPGADIRVRITLTDEDFANDDPIGTVEISAADLARALAEGQQIPVITQLQGSGYIVAVAISVRRE